MARHAASLRLARAVKSRRAAAFDVSRASAAFDRQPVSAIRSRHSNRSHRSNTDPQLFRWVENSFPLRRFFPTFLSHIVMPKGKVRCIFEIFWARTGKFEQFLRFTQM
jgi:hypothetical protein